MRFALTAPDVMAIVNFRFRSEYHGVPPDTVMDMRGLGAGFIAINGNVM
jgi:hypothetical protein